MKIGIVTNTNKDAGLEVTLKVIDTLKQQKIDFALENLTYEYIARLGLDQGYEHYDLDILPQKVKLVIAIGGDGTILFTAKQCAPYEVAVVGVNRGKLGFLSEIEPTAEDIADKINKIKNGQFQVEYVNMIKYQTPTIEGYALNDVVIRRNPPSRMIIFEVLVDQERVDEYNADGFIVCTPTGSTAYSLSAGGPILNPSINGFVLTPICSHSLHNRPIVVSDDSIINLKTRSDMNSMLIADGEVITEKNTGLIITAENVTLKKADIKAAFIRIDKRSFYQRLNNIGVKLLKE